MKYTLLVSLVLFFSACASPENGNPPDDIGSGFPEDYVITIEGEEAALATGTEEDSLEAGEDPVDFTNLDTDGENDPLDIQDKNAELSLEIESLTMKIAALQKELQEKESTATPTGGTSLKPAHLALLKGAIVKNDQKEYPFNTCGQMGRFLKSSWYPAFSKALNDSKIRFSNGYLETSDLFGGCQSTKGKTAFFLGAERNDDLKFFLLKFNTAEKTLEPALFFDGAEEAIITQFGKRNGSFVAFPSDDGRVFRYYYDANIVIEEGTE